MKRRSKAHQEARGHYMDALTMHDLYESYLYTEWNIGAWLETVVIFWEAQDDLRKAKGEYHRARRNDA